MERTNVTSIFAHISTSKSKFEIYSTFFGCKVDQEKVSRDVLVRTKFFSKPL